MDRGVLTMKTSYSDKDFKIEWGSIKEIYTRNKLIITLSDGTKYSSIITSIKDSVITVTSDMGFEKEHKINDIVHLHPYEEKFLNRLDASIDVGLSMAKAQNLNQLTVRSTLAYIADKWSTDISLNSLSSIQDSVDAIKRTDGEINFRYMLPRNWYPIATIALLSNTEQKLDLRMNAQLGIGKFFIRSNSAYWGMKIGANRNVEQYVSETANRESWEGYFGTELNLYNIGDFSLSTVIMAYPSFTEPGRWRSDFNLDIKYDLPLGFYIKLGGSFNYDNKPAEGASETDYVFQTGFGWEL